MQSWLLLAGLALSLGGAVIAGLADAWLSRSLLIYLDAVEHNLQNVVRTIQSGGAHDHTATAPNLKRDRGQDRARAAKSLGWLALAVGLGLQIVAVLLTKFAG